MADAVVSSRVAAKLANSAEEIADREAARFMGMSRELGLGAAFGFTFILIFCAAALLFFWKVVLPDREQSRQNQKVDGETKTILARAYEKIADDVAEQKAATSGLKTEIGLLRSDYKAASERHHEGQQAQWKTLMEIRDRLPRPVTPVTAAKPDRPKAPPMPETEKTP